MKLRELFVFGVLAAAGRAADYTQDVRPILARKCFACHGPGLQKSHLRLDRREDALRGGESGVPAIEPGKAA
ncbi:MAG: hypothetical protein NTW74_00270, partial [Acidobacteria bacterium]|nr:hypothetical protein [Acidobacteriota bacterium]